MAGAAVSTALKQKMAGAGGHAWSYVEVWEDGVKKATLQVTGGQVTYDRTSNTFRSLTCTLAGFEAIVPELGSLPPAGTFSDTNGKFGDGPFGDGIRERLRSLITPAVSKLHPFMAVLMDDATVETVPLGVYTTTSADFKHTASGVQVTITGSDLLYNLSLAGYERILSWAQGTNLRTVLVDLVADCLPGAPVSVPSTQFVSARTALIPGPSSNPRADAAKIALMAGWVLRTDRDGTIVAEPPPSVSGGTSVWSIKVANIVSAGTKLDDQNAINTLVVEGMTSEDIPVRGVAQVVGGTFGKQKIGRRTKTVQTEGAVSQAQAQFIAAAMLPYYTGISDVVSLQVPPLFHIDPYQLVDVTDAQLGLGDTVYMVDRVVIDLTLTRPTDLTVSRRVA